MKIWPKLVAIKCWMQFRLSKLGNKFFIILVNILSYSLLSTFVILQNFFIFLLALLSKKIFNATFSLISEQNLTDRYLMLIICHEISFFTSLVTFLPNIHEHLGNFILGNFFIGKFSKTFCPQFATVATGAKLARICIYDTISYGCMNANSISPLLCVS